METQTLTRKKHHNQMEKHSVSLLLSAYNEDAILETNLRKLLDYFRSLEGMEWEIVLVNDGSTDQTGVIADSLAEENPRIRVFHHRTNYGLGKGLQTAIEKSRGDYVITYDLDLSMSMDHIGRLLDKILTTNAKVVIASPVLAEGKYIGMPYYRKFLSLSANKFLSFFSPEKISCLTSMARAYNGDYIRNLNLRSSGMEIMPEILYKTMVLHESMEEIPATLAWEQKDPHKPRRTSKMKIISHTLGTLFAGFLLKPFLFFILPGLLLFLFSLYPFTWMMIHFFHEYALIQTPESFTSHASDALAKAYELHPHTFVIAFFSLVLSIQLLAIGLQSLQSKHYFEELFNLLTKMYRRQK